MKWLTTVNYSPNSIFRFIFSIIYIDASHSIHWFIFKKPLWSIDHNLSIDSLILIDM